MDILGDFSHEERGDALPASGTSWRLGLGLAAIGLTVVSLMLIRYFV